MTTGDLRKLILEKTFVREDCAGWINRLGILAADTGMRMYAISWGSSPERIVMEMADQILNGATKPAALFALLDEPVAEVVRGGPSR